MRGKNLVKLLRAVELLSKPDGTTIEEMASQLEVDRRSVYRMLNLVEDLGFPLYDDRVPLEREKRWKLEEGYLKKLPNIRVPDLNLSLPELITLCLLRNEMGVLKGTELERHAQSAFDKLSLFMPQEALRQLQKIKALFVPASKFVKDYSAKEEIINQLMDAMLKSRTCHVVYHSFYDDKTKTFAIDPLHFFERNGGLYALVNTTTFGEIRTLAVERIKEITNTGMEFEYPRDFDPEELLASAFDFVYGDPIKVRIRFSAEQARYIKERQWSRSQSIEEQEDGSVVLSMSTSGWWDVKRWVLSYGQDAEVLGPESLRREIATDLSHLKRVYAL